MRTFGIPFLSKPNVGLVLPDMSLSSMMLASQGQPQELASPHGLLPLLRVFRWDFQVIDVISSSIHQLGSVAGTGTARTRHLRLQRIGMVKAMVYHGVPLNHSQKLSCRTSTHCLIDTLWQKILSIQNKTPKIIRKKTTTNSMMVDPK